MAFIPAWRNFKRMQDTTVAAAGLIYAGAVVDAYGRLPGSPRAVLIWTLASPGVFLAAALVIPLAVPPARRWLSKYVWMSFQAGFGQRVSSVITGVVLLMGAGLFAWWQVGRDAARGQVGANVFSAFGAGIGILAAQAVLARVLERDPAVRAVIEARD